MLSFIDFSFDPMNNDEDDEEQCLQSLQADNESVMKDYREIMNSEEIKYWKWWMQSTPTCEGRGWLRSI